MAITLAGTSGAVTVSTTANVTPAFDAATTAGELGVAYIQTNATAAITTASSGWTVVQGGATAGIPNAALAYKPNMGAGESAPTFTCTGSTNTAAYLERYDGVATTTPLAQSNSGTASLAAALSAADAAAGNLVVAAFGIVASKSATYTFSHSWSPAGGTSLASSSNGATKNTSFVVGATYVTSSVSSAAQDTMTATPSTGVVSSQKWAIASFKPAATGTLYTQSVSGTVSFTGSMSRSTGHQLAATLAFVGALTRFSSRTVTAALSFTGSLVRRTARSLVATLRSSGAVTGAKNVGTAYTQTLTATLVFTGAVTRSTGRFVTAGVSFTGAVARRTAHGLTGALTFTGGINRRTARQFASSSTAAQKIGIPAYWAPTDTTDINGVIAAAAKVQFVVVDVTATGPGTSFSSAWLTMVQGYQNAGITVYGYVEIFSNAAQTTYRGTATIETDVDNWYTWYNVDGIFYDNLNSDVVANGANYLTLYNYVKAKTGVRGTSVITNYGGVQSSESAMSYCDIICDGEYQESTYLGGTLTSLYPSWRTTYPAARFWHIVYNATTANISADVAQTNNYHAGYFYLLDVGGTTPSYSTLPTSTEWNGELALVTLVTTGLGFAGSIAKTTGKTFAAGLTSTATLAKRIARNFTASQTLAGAFSTVKNGGAHAFTQALTATLTFTGAVTRKTSRTVSGTLTFTGTTTRAASRALTATVTFTGAVVKATSRTLTAVLRSSGVAARQTGKMLTGTLTFTGSRTVRVARSLAATTGFTAAFSAVKTGGGHAFTQALTATLTFTGATSRTTSRLLTATLTTTGSIRRGTSRALTATLSTSGAIRKATTQALTAALTFTGTVAKRTGRGLIATVGFTATVVTSSARNAIGYSRQALQYIASAVGVTTSAFTSRATQSADGSVTDLGSSSGGVS